MLVPCSECNQEWTKQNNPQYKDAIFVCKLCRCMDCQIVLNKECECGERHGERSLEDRRVCVSCISIRDRVSRMDLESLKLRAFEFSSERPLYE